MYLAHACGEMRVNEADEDLPVLDKDTCAAVSPAVGTGRVLILRKPAHAESTPAQLT